MTFDFSPLMSVITAYQTAGPLPMAFSVVMVVGQILSGEEATILELENLLSLQEDVLEAAVVGVPDERWGERPLAIIVPVEGAEERITAETMQKHLQKFVADGVITKWSVSEHYAFVKELPKTSVGKIDKKVLRSRYPTAPAD